MFATYGDIALVSHLQNTPQFQFYDSVQNFDEKTVDHVKQCALQHC